MRCLQCGEKLQWLPRLKNSKFCSVEHRTLYQENQDKTAFAELTSRKGTKQAPVDEEAEAGGPDWSATEAQSVESAVATAEAPSEPADLASELGLGGFDDEPLAPEPETEQIASDLNAIGVAAAGEVSDAEVDACDEDSLAERYARFLSMVDAERHYYQDLLDRLPAGVAVIGEDIRVVYSNRLFRQLQAQEGDEAEQLGLTSTEVRDAIHELLSPESDQREPEPVSIEREKGSIRVEPIALRSKDGAGVKGVLLFASPNCKPELARTD